MDSNTCKPVFTLRPRQQCETRDSAAADIHRGQWRRCVQVSSRIFCAPWRRFLRISKQRYDHEKQHVPVACSCPLVCRPGRLWRLWPDRGCSWRYLRLDIPRAATYRHCRDRRQYTDSGQQAALDPCDSVCTTARPSHLLSRRPVGAAPRRACFHCPPAVISDMPFRMGTVPRVITTVQKRR